MQVGFFVFCFFLKGGRVRGWHERNWLKREGAGQKKRRKGEGAQTKQIG